MMLGVVDQEAFQAVKDQVAAQVAKLNPQQQRAVYATEGPCLILAGAGTGKTTVLTTRLAYLIAEKGCDLAQLLAVTFTNKAAAEMKNRLGSILGNDDLKAPWIGTFHHVCVRILRRHADLLGLPERFLIVDSDDQLRLIKQVLKAQSKEEKTFPPRTFAWALGRLKDRALLPEQVTATESQMLLGEGPRAAFLPQLYTTYQEALTTMGGVDFGDLILLCIKLFRQHPAILDFYRQKFHYLLVDEYQDSNVAQYVWLRLLAGEAQNVCCVGDDDQSIYGWRGAEVTHILNFEKDFPGTTVIRLEENYRSTGAILNAASVLIDHNKGRLGKTLKPALGKEGQPIMVKGLSDDKAEAYFIGHEINDLIAGGHPAENIAVLVRATFQTREIEERLISLGVPYRLVGATRFYERMEIKDAVAYLRILSNPNDNLALERALGTPKRGIGGTTLQKLHQFGRDNNISLWAAMQKNAFPGQAGDAFTLGGDVSPLLGKGPQQKVAGFVQDVQMWQEKTESLSPEEALRFVLDASGYQDFWKVQKTDDSQARLENLKELSSVLAGFDSLDLFLEHAALVTEAKETDSKAVSLMTIHAAKGLEFQTVFLAGWEEGLFPHPKALEESGTKGLEEERRLAYVGLTRAKEKVFITFASSRCLFGSFQPMIPSRFLTELGAEITRPPMFKKSVGLGRSGQSSRTAFQNRPVFHKRSVDETKKGVFQPGQRVSHRLFGDGVVMATEGDIITVRFPDEKRKIVSRFLETADKNL